MNRSLYQAVTDRITEALSRGVVPWRKPWRGTDSMPRNAVTHRPYRGVNVLLLNLAPYTDGRWLSFKQAQSLGGMVRRGERATQVVFWKPLEIAQDEDLGEPSRHRTVPLLRFYYVFNVEQCEGLRLPNITQDRPARANDRIKQAEAFCRSIPNPPRIVEGAPAAYYRPSDDTVAVPRRSCFGSIDAFYATLFHELGHATGHEKRLARSGVTGQIVFGSEDYSREELVAELTSAFCCTAIGLDNSLVENAASYIDGWLSALRHDQTAIVFVSAQNERPTDYLADVHPIFNEARGTS